MVNLYIIIQLTFFNKLFILQYITVYYNILSSFILNFKKDPVDLYIVQ